MDGLKRRIEKLGAWTDVLLIVLVSALAYLPLIGQLGYYRDDWHVAWAGMTQGPAKIFDLHVIDRPLMGVLYSLTYSVLRDAPLAWQLYAVLLRITGALLFLWLLRLLWPGKRLPTTLMALLFAVYPGFLQMPTASAYSNHLVGLAAGIFSIALSIRALQVSRLPLRAALIALAVLSGLVCYGIMEYMVSLEGVRLLLMGYLLLRCQEETWKTRVMRLFRRWAPYLGGLAVFLVWRVLFFKSARAVTDVGALARGYLSAPGEMFARVIVEWVRGALNALFLAWGYPFYNLTMSASYADLLVAVILAALAAILLLVYLRFAPRDSVSEQALPGNDRTWARDAIWLGLAVVLVNLLTIVLANREIRLTDTFDRYTLPASLGVAMFLVGLLYHGVSRGLRVPLLVLLLSVSMITQFQNGVFFRNFWRYERQLWWQLSWRAPGLAKNTVLIPALPAPYMLAESYEVWGPANLIYATKDDPLAVVGEALNNETLGYLTNRQSFNRTVRRVSFTLDFKNSLVMSIPTGGACLHVLDSQWLEFSSNESPLSRLVAPYSRIDLIQAGATSKAPPVVVFGAEPPHGWCYYYQKASLARQRKDWGEVVRLGDEARSMGLQPQDFSEWMPFYQGYAYQSRMDDANALAGFLRADEVFNRTFCQQFTPERMAAYRKGSIDEFIVANICPQP